MTWAVLLLQDNETLQTYEAFARESTYEEEGDIPPYTNSSHHMHQEQEPRPPRQRHTQQTNHAQPGTSAEATGMGVDQDLQDQGTPPGNTFEDGFTPSTTRGHTPSVPTGPASTGNYYTPLYTDTHHDGDTAAAGGTASANTDDADAEASTEARAAFVARMAAEREAAEAA